MEEISFDQMVLAFSWKMRFPSNRMNSPEWCSYQSEVRHELNSVNITATNYTMCVCLEKYVLYRDVVGA